MDISVIICCYNSFHRIRPTLEHISSQDLQNLLIEVILVNNKCNDDTVNYAKKVWFECGTPFNLHIIEEKQPGLSYARKSGVLAAKGEIVIFCDDDNWLDKNYIFNAYSTLTLNNNIGVLGGRSIPKAENELPLWFTSFQSHYAVGVQALNSGIVNNREYLWGAGMSFRRLDMLNLFSCGFSNILKDRSNDGTLISGGDTEICKWFRLIGKDLYYDENLLFYHFIDETRLSREYLKSLLKSFDNYSDIISKYHLAIKIVQLNNLKFSFKNLRIIFFLLRKQKFTELKVYIQFHSYRYFVFDRFYYKVFNNLNLFSKL